MKHPLFSTVIKGVLLTLLMGIPLEPGLEPNLGRGVWPLTQAKAQARPEHVRAGVSYYADSFVRKGGIADLEGEKNLEEVYQFYEYYEAIYDAQGKVTTFIAYLRGEEAWREVYRYGPGGRALRKELIRDGKREIMDME